MTVQQIGLGLRDDLRSNLTDPINRQIGQWIHYDRLSSTGKTPVIYIQHAPSARQEDFIGGGQTIFSNFLIHVVVRNGDQGISPSGGSTTIITNDDELRGALIDAVVTRLQLARTAISGAEVVHYLGDDGEFNLTTDRIVNSLRYEAQKI